SVSCVFCFRAEDCIRYRNVTGVQTCALPISFDTFFIDPYGDVMPCNGTKDKEVMGNLNMQTWDELWNSLEAEKVRKKVRCCDRRSEERRVGKVGSAVWSLCEFSRRCHRSCST